MPFQYIPYNPANDPLQYLAQGLAGGLNAVGRGWLGKQQRQQLQGDIQNLIGGNYSNLQNPAIQGQVAQAMVGQLLPSVSEQARLASALQVSPSEEISKEKLTRLRELQAKEANGTITDAERQMLTRMLGGGSLVELTLGQPASPTERTAIASGRASIDSLDNLKSLFDNPKTQTGPVIGRTSPIKGLVGLTTPEQESFMAATTAFKNAIIKEITGAQMSEAEADRIMRQVPDITDPPQRWLAKWQQSKKNLEVLQRRRLEILSQSGMRVPSSEQIPTEQGGARSAWPRNNQRIAVKGPNGEIGTMDIQEFQEARKHGWRQR